MSALTLERLEGIGIYAEDSAANSGDELQAIGLVRQDTLAISTSTDGDYGNFKSNAKGELYVIDTDGNALLTTIDADTGAMAVDLAAIEVLITAGNVDLAAIEVLLTTIDADTSAIALDTAAMVVDLAAIEVLLTSIDSDTAAMVVDLAAIEVLLTTIDADTSAIALDTAAMVVDLAAIEVLLTSIDADTAAMVVDLAAIEVLLTGINDDAADSGGSLKVGSRSHFASSALTALSTDGDRADLLSDAYRRVYINDAPNISAACVAVSVGTSEAALPAANLAGRTRMLVQNNGNVSIYVGPTGVTTATGIEVSKGSTLALEAGQAINLFAISTLAAQDVRVFELA